MAPLLQRTRIPARACSASEAILCLVPCGPLGQSPLATQPLNCVDETPSRRTADGGSELHLCVEPPEGTQR